MSASVLSSDAISGGVCHEHILLQSPVGLQLPPLNLIDLAF
jgi:hypothetical protein